MALKTLLSQTSTTYLGVIVAGIMSIGSMAGVDLVEQDVSNVVMLAALALIVIGRAKAKGPASWWTAIFGGKSDVDQHGRAAWGSIGSALLAGLLGAAVLLAVLAAPGCALQGRADVVLYEMADTYADLHADYVTAYEASDETGRAWMRREIAPAMDRAKHVLDAALTTAIAGQDVRDRDLAEAKAALTEAALAISDIILVLGGE